jgi:hypothetical protein
MSFGRYPDVPLAMARTRHGEARKLLATGTDPMTQRKADKTAKHVASENSFASICQKWMDHWHEDKSSRHVDQTRRRLDANILPSLGSLQTDQITAPDIVAMVRTIEERGARDIAKRALDTRLAIQQQIFAPETYSKPHRKSAASIGVSGSSVKSRSWPDFGVHEPGGEYLKIAVVKRILLPRPCASP